MTEVKKARAITAILGGSAAAAAPSTKLRRRILASVGVEQKSFGWAPWLATAVAVLSIVAAVYFGGQQRDALLQNARLRDQLGQQNMELTRLNEAFAILSGPETTVTSFGAGPKGKVFVSPRQGVMLIASNLPPLPRGKVYEMWFFRKGVPAPARAGEFQSQSDGSAMHIQRASLEPGSLAAVAVTIENDGGADTPTLPPVFAVTLQ